MREIYSNINIIGGGLIGVATAYSLSRFGFDITILEKNPINNFNKHTSDQRTVAISEGTKVFLDKIDLWKKINKFSQPIKKIMVIDRKPTNVLEFDNERRSSNVGYIVKNKDLIEILYNELKQLKNVKIINNFNIVNIQSYADSVVTTSNNYHIKSDLIIAADGKNSYVRKLYKTPFYKKDYHKKALIVNFTHSKNHNSTAFEFFYKNGPLAILPMKKNKSHFKSSIVWTNKIQYLENLMNIKDAQLKLILNEKTNSYLGSINKIINKQLFPLSAHLNSRFYENRVIYIGDSAHSFHPIAGQGWNLGMSDVKNLYNLVNKYKLLGIGLGGPIFCKEFHSKNYYNAYRLYQITDKLDGLFKLQNPLLRFARSTGMNFIKNNPKISGLISDFAMGIN
tara:strand:+ start:145 stop:1329 length:1185 start_codon:yes stop_codon:yes gene_type:complete